MPLSTYWHRLTSTFMLVLVGGFFTLSAQITPPASDTGTPFDTLRWQADEEIRRTQDPALGRVPYERLDDARAELAARQQTADKTGIPNTTWQERGPTNAGGTTKALMFDLTDPTRKKVWAGSVSGGLWYTNDITVVDSSWHPVSDNWENLNISALAADPSNPQVMYAGTGDGFGSYYAPNGGGIWKTANGGTTWTRLTSTIPASAGTPQQVGFGSIMKLIVNSSGIVFVATRYGVMRSTDGGNSWQFVLAPQQGIGGVPPLGTSGASNLDDFTTDLEIGSDNIVYAAFRNGRIFRANAADGTSWSEITPPNTAPYNGTRAELALAPSTSGSGQVVYAISSFYNPNNYYADIKWYSRSSNGGNSWSSIPIPAYSGNSTWHFTIGSAAMSLVLVVAADNPNTVYLSSVYGYWLRSTDGGQSLSSSTVVLPQIYSILFGTGRSAIWGSASGPAYLADSNDLFTGTSVQSERSTNYRTTEINSVSLRNSANSAFTWLSTNNRFGVGSLNKAGAGPASGISPYSSALAYLDQDQPGIGIMYFGGNYINLYDLVAGSVTQKQLLYSSVYSFISDYDSQNNIFYTYQNGLQKVTGIGTTNQVSALNASVNGTPQCIKAGKSANTLFIAGPAGLLYKVTNADQASPTLIRIDNDALPATANINCIEVGADDNELLVVLSNYGVRSVWYTSNGGQTWISKDESGYGLPDMPIRWAIFNPANRKQVMLATELGIWSTTDITATNPGWQPTLAGMPVIRCNMLRHRTADGRVVVATQGRGVWETNVWATAYTLPTLTIAGLSSASLCVGGTVSVTVAVTNGTVNSGNTYSLYLSDANGSFANAYKLTSGSSTVQTATLPTYINSVSVAYGTNYRLKVTASDPETESAPSNPITIGTVTNVSVITRELPNYNGFTVCPGSLVNFFANFSGQRDLPGQYEWRLNGNVIANATNDTITVSQPGTYQLTFRQGGCLVTASNALSNSTAIYGFATIANGGSTPGPQCNGQRTRMVASYVGNSAVFQWQRNGVAIPGATQYAYEATQTGVYSFTVRDGSCQNTGITSGLSLVFGQNLSATISTFSTLVCPGYSNFMSLQESSVNGYTYQWQRNGIDISGATNYYYYGGPQATYTVKVAQGNCKTISNALTLQTGVLPVTLSNTGNKLICTGDSRSVYVSGIGPYQWQKNGVDIAGATNSNYTVTTSGVYSAKVGPAGCVATSPEVTYQVGTSFVPIINVSNAESCSSSVDPAYLYTTYSSAYTYQWLRDGIDISGATQSSYSANRAGTYGVRINTAGGCSGTGYIASQRSGLPKPVISAYGSPQRCVGSAVRLTSSYYNGNVSYQWKRYGIPIPGATDYYTFYATENGSYTLAIRQATCEVESDPIEVSIGQTTSAYLSGNTLVSAGQAVSLPVSYYGAPPWSFTLSNGQSVQNTYANPYFINVAPTATTTYTLASVSNTCGTGYANGSAQVRVESGSADVSLTMQVSNRTPAVNDLVSYSVTLTNAGPQTAQAVQVTNRLPIGVDFVDSPSAAVRVIDSVLTIDAGSIQVGVPVTYSFRARASKPGVFVNAAQITNVTTPDPDSQPGSGTGDGQDDAAQVDFRTLEPSDRVTYSNNPNQTPLPVLQSSQPTADLATADLSLALQVDNRTPNAGSNDIVTATLTVSNRGGSAASNVAVQIELPNGGFDYQNAPGWTPITTDKLYNGFINAIPAGGSASLKLRWQPSGSGLLKAQILDVNEPDPDSTPGNGTGKGEDDEATADVRAR